MSIPTKPQSNTASQKQRSFSIVMAVYNGDEPEYLKLAIDSLLNQTLAPDEIVIVIDGPIKPTLNSILNLYESKRLVSLIKLPTNKGLGNALNVGISHAKNELIARMDADDIAAKNRFEIQISEFINRPEIDILGGQITEFIDDPRDIAAYRNVPTTHEEIRRFARRRNPFNHPTVMFKKSTIQQLGGYDIKAIRIEDYDLWLRAIAKGAVCANTNDILLYYRSTTDALKRRKTITSLKNHIVARTRFYKRGDIQFSDYVYGIVTQAMLFMMPTKLADILFKKVLRN